MEKLEETNKYKDEFGILKIYEDYPGRNYFALKSNNMHEKRFLKDKPVPTSNGWFRFPTGHKKGQGRIEILSNVDANEETIPTFNLKKVLEERDGVLFKDPNSPDGDFQDIEITWRIKMKGHGHGHEDGGYHIELVPGGLNQADDDKKLVGKDKNIIAQCEAMSYHANVYPTQGRVKFEKDTKHTDGYTTDKSDPVDKHAFKPFSKDQEIIHKFVIYRIKGNDKWNHFMKLEQYIDETGKGDNFKKVLEKIDDGQWGPTKKGNKQCCENDKQYEYVVLWMTRCAIGIRCDGLDDMGDLLFKDWSIRSINPDKLIHKSST